MGVPGNGGLEELVSVIDLQGHPRTATRREVDRDRLMAEGSRVFVTTKAGEYLLQRRAQKKNIYPNHWDFGAAETRRPGESAEETAIRGMKEELGLQIRKGELGYLGEFVYDGEEEKRQVAVYWLVHDEQCHGPIRRQASEVSRVKNVKPERIERILAKVLFSPIGEYAYRQIICPRKDLYTCAASVRTA